VIPCETSPTVLLIPPEAQLAQDEHPRTLLCLLPEFNRKSPLPNYKSLLLERPNARLLSPKFLLLHMRGCPGKFSGRRSIPDP